MSLLRINLRRNLKKSKQPIGKAKKKEKNKKTEKEQTKK